MTFPVTCTDMGPQPFCIILDADLEDPIRNMARKRENCTTDNLANSAIRMYIDAMQAPGAEGQDLVYENEVLHSRVKELEKQVQRKDEQISVLLTLWQQCPIKEGEREVPAELEEKISRLLRNWYFDSERKDFSGADGGSEQG
jgi:hypothetical protein